MAEGRENNRRHHRNATYPDDYGEDMYDACNDNINHGTPELLRPAQVLSHDETDCPKSSDLIDRPFVY